LVYVKKKRLIIEKNIYKIIYTIKILIVLVRCGIIKRMMSSGGGY